MLHIKKCNNGFTLIEMLVSAAILSAVIVAVIGVVRKGRELQANDMHRREVRAIINSRLEKSYQYSSFKSINSGSFSDTITIDPRWGNSLTGEIYETVDSTSMVISGTVVPVKKISISIAWDESDGKRDSIALKKWLAEAK